MAGINISFVSDVRSFIKGTDDIERAMDDVGDSLDDVSKDAKTAGDKIERSLSDAGKDAEDSSEKMEKSFRKDFDKVEEKAKDAGATIGKESKQGFAKAEKAADDFKRKGVGASDEFKQEAGANFSETASSFTGDMEGAVAGIQGTLGGLATSAIPGVGIAAGIAAAGIGTVYTILNTQAEATKQNIEDLTLAMIEANSKVVAESVIQENLKTIVSGGEDAAISMGNLREAAEETGVPIATLARAYAGDPGSVAEALAIVNTKFGEAQDALGVYETSVAASKTADELSRWKTALQGLETGYDSAATGLELYQDAAAQGAQENQREIGETRKAYEDAHRAVGDLSTAVQNIPAPAPISVPVHIDTTAAEQEIATFLGKRRVVDSYIYARPGVGNP